MNKKQKNIVALVILIAAGVYSLSKDMLPDNQVTTKPASIDEASGSHQAKVSVKGDLSKLQRAVKNKQSKVWFLETQFKVKKVLADDLKGSRHQRFLVHHTGLPTLLVAHNIDIGKRIPLRVGQTIYIKGRYEWNDKGGVLHWTHGDPRGKQAGGWVRLGDQYYK